MVLDLIFFRNTGCLLVIFSWIKVDMHDIIIFDIWIETCVMENKCQGFSSIDANGEASYQLWSIKK